MSDDFVTQRECSERREDCEKYRMVDHDCLTRLTAKIGLVERMMWAIIGILTGGFACVVLAVVQAGRV